MTWTKLVKIFILCIPVIAYPASEMTGIDFIQEGEISKVVFSFDQEGVKVLKTANEKNKQIILDFSDIGASGRVMRAFDASEFAGSVVFVSPYRKPGNPKDIRVAIQLRENVRSVIEVTGRKLVVNIENRFGVFSQEDTGKGGSIKSSTNRVGELGLFDKNINVPKSDSVEDILENLIQSGPKKYIGKRVHFDVKNIAVGDLLKVLADASGFNIIVDQVVNAAAPITLSLVNIPWDQALDTILNISNLVAKKNGNILIVTTLAEARKERQAELAAQQMREVQEPLVTKIFPISYANAQELIQTLKEYMTKNRGTLSFDNRTNQLIVKDTVEVVERIKKMIEVLDTQTPQILIEAKVVEANESFSQRIGFNSGLSGQYNLLGETNSLAQAQDNGPEFTFSTISKGAGGSTFLGISVNVFKRLVGLNMALQLLEEESKGRIISTPKVITQNKQAATIVSSRSTYFIKEVVTEGGRIQRSFEPISAPLSLSVTPQVTNEGAIIMKVAVQKSALIATESSIRSGAPPDRTSNNVNTNVLVDNGSTVVIGGIYSFVEGETYAGIPFLKDIPLLGWLFRTPYSPQQSKQELIIFLTPRIINEEEAGISTGVSVESPLG